MKLIFSGGTAAPRATIEKFHDLLGVFLLHAWGMTETSPLVTLGSPLARHDGATQAEIVDMQVKQGRQVSGVELRLVGEDGEALPHDGKSVGQLKVRGNWVISGYFKGEGGKVVDDDGWFGTGDVATINPDGYVQLTDRLKDVIKSGGEWISSIEIENLVVSHPDVFEAAVIAIPHPKWQERPLLLVQPKPGATSDQAVDPGIPVDADRQMVDAGRCDLRGVAAAYRDRQAAQNRASRQIWRSVRGCRVKSLAARMEMAERSPLRQSGI